MKLTSIKLLLLLFAFQSSLSAQIGINTEKANKHAVIDIRSDNNDKGLVFPRWNSSRFNTINTSVGPCLPDGLSAYDETNQRFSYLTRGDCPEDPAVISAEGFGVWNSFCPADYFDSASESLLSRADLLTAEVNELNSEVGTWRQDEWQSVCEGSGGTVQFENRWGSNIGADLCPISFKKDKFNNLFFHIDYHLYTHPESYGGGELTGLIFILPPEYRPQEDQVDYIYRFVSASNTYAKKIIIKTNGEVRLLDDDHLASQQEYSGGLMRFRLK